MSIVLISASVAPAVECDPHWDNTIGQPGMDFRISALAVFDDGTGPALYAGGVFTIAGGEAANYVARWNAGTETWSPLGGGLNNTVRTLAVFDDGAGPALYAGGHFALADGITVNNVARWDGNAWSALGSGMSGPKGPQYVGVSVLKVFDDGSGPALYAGGSFTIAGGLNASRIAKWNGSQWSALGSGINNGSDWGQVTALAAFDDGSGAALFASGQFNTAGTTQVQHIAKWDGDHWSSLGTDMNSGAACLAVFDDGSGPALYAGGIFTMVGGVEVNSIAKWDGQQWHSLQTGMAGSPTLPPVASIAVFDDGSGSALYAGGHFSSAGGVPAASIARWDGQDWSAVGSGMGGHIPNVSALTVFIDETGETGPTLFAGGKFTIAGGLPANHIAAWRGCASPSVPGDLNGDEIVDVSDLLVLLSAWGPCPRSGDCPADINGDGMVDVSDLLILLANWG